MKTGPRCPNHGVYLVDCDWKSQKGICPISGAIFGFDADSAKKNKKLRLTALGTMEEVSDWKVTHIEGSDD